jgi:hypothetical protein
MSGAQPDGFDGPENTGMELPPILSSFYGSPMPGSTARLLALWFGPAVAAAVATSWLSGRRGRGSKRGALLGVFAAFAAGLLVCVVRQMVWGAPLLGAIVAVLTVLRSD